MFYYGRLVPTLTPRFDLGLHLHLKQPTEGDPDRVGFYALDCVQSTVFRVERQGWLYRLTDRQLVSLIALHWECEAYLQKVSRGTYLMLAGVHGVMDTCGPSANSGPGPQSNGRLRADVITIAGQPSGFFHSSQPVEPAAQQAVTRVYDHFVRPWFGRMQLQLAHA